MPAANESDTLGSEANRLSTPNLQTGTHSLMPERPYPALDSEIDQVEFERHAALIGEVRTVGLPDTLHRAMVVRRLQRDYGNSYVQRLLEHLSRQPVSAVRSELTEQPSDPGLPALE